MSGSQPRYRELSSKEYLRLKIQLKTKIAGISYTCPECHNQDVTLWIARNEFTSRQRFPRTLKCDLCGYQFPYEIMIPPKVLVEEYERLTGEHVDYDTL